jgi:hypothetical protein
VSAPSKVWWSEKWGGFIAVNTAEVPSYWVIGMLEDYGYMSSLPADAIEYVPVSSSVPVADRDRVRDLVGCEVRVVPRSAADELVTYVGELCSFDSVSGLAVVDSAPAGQSWQGYRVRRTFSLAVYEVLRPS